MTLFQKIKNIVTAVFMILFALLLMILGEDAYLIILDILIFALILNAIRKLWFYFTMARYMTGGRAVLYRGILYFDLGLYAYTLNDVSSDYIMIYLSALLGFSGIVDVLNALDARKIHGPWKLRMIRGAGTIFFAAFALISLRSPYTVVMIYSISLIYNAVMRICNVMKPQEIVMIQQ